MAHALRSVPVAATPKVPEGVVQVGGEWMYDEFANGQGVTSVGLDEQPPPTPPTEEEKKSILDLFKN